MKNSIIFFSLSLKKGGAENQLTKLAEFLIKNTAYSVTILYFVKGNDFENLEKQGIKVKFFSLRKIMGIYSFIHYLMKNRPILVISFMFGANIIARFTKLIFRFPIITSVRNNNISKLYYILYKITYHLDDFTTFNSKYALGKFLNIKISSKSKSLLINNAISIPKNPPKKNDNEVFTMVSLAHFRPQKDYRTLFEAIDLLKKDNISLKLYVLGHLYGNRWPFEMIKDLGIENQVDIVGFTMNTGKYLSSSDVLILSSLWEGTPNAILEGMSYKLPIIASRIAGVEELVEDSQCGLLFEPQNAESLKSSIIQMINFSKSKRHQMGKNGFEYILENFTDQTVYLKWINLINQVVNEK